jgi:response regulator NasT
MRFNQIINLQKYCLWHAICFNSGVVKRKICYMDLILVADCLDSSQPLLRVASKAGYRILKLIGPNDEACRYVETLCPDAMIIVSDEIDRPILREMRAVTERKPTPMLVFTRDSEPESIDLAVKAGATAYVVDCNDPARLSSLLGVAQARFDEQQRLKKELLHTKNALQERKSVEKAKGIIMKSKRLSEDQAYKAMRKLAMNHNKRMGEIAEQIISASEVLV